MQYLQRKFLQRITHRESSMSGYELILLSTVFYRPI